MKIYYAAFEPIALEQALEKIILKDDTFHFSVDKMAIDLYILGCQKMIDIKAVPKEPVPFIFEIELLTK